MRVGSAEIRRVASSPSSPRHADVHHDDLRQDAAGEVDGLAHVRRLAGDLQLVLGRDQRGETGADGGLVVGNEDANHAPRR